jgi:putative endonuclease
MNFSDKDMESLRGHERKGKQMLPFFYFMKLYDMYYSYVLRSVKNGILYKGSTSDLSKRIKAHNEGEVKYTSKHLPWELVIYEQFSVRSEAIRREKWYKTGVGRDWIKMRLAE